MTKHHQLIVVAGPTAVGKTSLAIDLAKHYQTEIISADSRQFYREMNIGTAKPAPEELETVPHHFIDNLSIEDKYDAGKFAEEAESLLKDLFTKYGKLILVGGSGMYIKALCEGFDEMPEIPEQLRTELTEAWTSGNRDGLLAELEKSDPEYFKQADLHNRQRVTRALEVIRVTGKPYSELRKGGHKVVNKEYSIVKIGLERDREALYHCINSRMDQMIDEGLFEEATSLYPFRHLNALQTVGYREIFDYMDGKYDKGEAIRLLKRNSRRYAKRQMTWFKRDEGFRWFEPNQIENIISYINTQD